MKNTALKVVLLVFVITSGLGLWLPALAFAFTLPDTGQTKCYNTSGAEVACAGTGQDGAYNINPISYTDNGNGTVTDNVTGLMWQKESNEESFTWHQASGTYHATYNPSSQNVCGSLTLGGYLDWRLPSKKELITIVDYSIPPMGPTISETYFPYTSSSYYWASTYIGVNYSDGAWGLQTNTTDPLTDTYDVRCVRGGQSSLSPSLIDNGNGTVTDSATGLIWQQEEPGTMTWGNALSYCEGLSLGDAADWRLPNVKELESIIDDTKWNPSVNRTYFPNLNTYFYWSSTSNALNNAYAWVVLLYYGSNLFGSKASSQGAYVRCVHGGQSGGQATTQSTTLNNCAASISSSLVVQIPILTYGSSNYWADLQYNSSNSRLTVAGAGAVSDVSPYSSCNVSTLSSGGILHIPVLMISGASYWLDLQYNGAAFVITAAGPN